MTPSGLERVRCAAALVHGAAPIGLRLRHDGRALLHVDRWGAPDGHPEVAWMPPRAFRAAVATALADVRRGRRLSILGLPERVDPALDVRTAPGAQLHPGPVVRTLAGERVTVVFATLLSAERTRATIDASGALPELTRAEVRAHADELLDVTVVALEQPIDVPASELERALAAASELLVACALACLGEQLARLEHLPSGGGAR